jgi:hypothetical protein
LRHVWVASANLVDDSEALEELADIRLGRAEVYVDQIDYSGRCRLSVRDYGHVPDVVVVINNRLG